MIERKANESIRDFFKNEKRALLITVPRVSMRPIVYCFRSKILK